MSHDYIIITIKCNMHSILLMNTKREQNERFGIELQCHPQWNLNSLRFNAEKTARSTYSYKYILSLIWGCTLTSFVSRNICGLWQVWTVEEAKKQAQRECYWLQCGSCHGWMGLSESALENVGDTRIVSEYELYLSAQVCLSAMVLSHTQNGSKWSTSPPSSLNSNRRVSGTAVTNPKIALDNREHDDKLRDFEVHCCQANPYVQKPPDTPFFCILLWSFDVYSEITRYWMVKPRCSLGKCPVVVGHTDHMFG